MNNIPPKIDRSIDKWIKCPCENPEHGICTITYKHCLTYENTIPNNCPAREGIFIKWEKEELEKEEINK